MSNHTAEVKTVHIILGRIKTSRGFVSLKSSNSPFSTSDHLCSLIHSFISFIQPAPAHGSIQLHCRPKVYTIEPLPFRSCLVRGVQMRSDSTHSRGGWGGVGAESPEQGEEVVGQRGEETAGTQAKGAACRSWACSGDRQKPARQEWSAGGRCPGGEGSEGGHEARSFHPIPP